MPCARGGGSRSRRRRRDAAHQRTGTPRFHQPDSDARCARPHSQRSVGGTMMAADEENIAQLEQELDGARRALKETLSTVEAKVTEGAEAVFNLQNLLRENLVGASCIAGLLGFVAGSGKYRKVAAAGILLALGYAVWNEFSNLRSNDHV